LFLAACGVLAAAGANQGVWQTANRLVFAGLLPLSLYALLRRVGCRERTSEAFLGLALVYVFVAWAHVIMTSRAAAWALDSHMVPWLVLPPTGRLGLAWGATLGWLGLLALAAGLLQRAHGSAIAPVLLLAAAVAPFFAGAALPTDAYALAFRPSAFVDPAYVAAGVLVLSANVLAVRSATRPELSALGRATT
jgi:hypothetical protein